MSTNLPPNASTNGHQSSGKSQFEEQREGLVRDISMSLEQVLQNLNKLNRSLEGVIAVGNEFSSVEALWSHFENVMAKQPEEGQKADDAEVRDGGSAEDDETVTVAQGANR